MSGGEKKMPLRASVHTHTSFCDGTDTPAAMARAAADLGLETLGFSGHGYVPQEDFGISPGRMAAYCEEIRRLQAAYAGQLEILCGIELDTQTPAEQMEQAKQLDYRIGSCHAVRDAQGRYWTVDNTPALLEQAVCEGFCGSAMALVQAYYDQFVPWVRVLRPDIVGHLDLVTKFNEDGRFFDETDPGYRRLAADALRALLHDDLILEVNTGAISRGWRRDPYPAQFLLRQIRQAGGRVTVTADAHSAGTLMFGVEQVLELLRETGFRSVWELGADGWDEKAI